MSIAMRLTMLERNRFVWWIVPSLEKTDNSADSWSLGNNCYYWPEGERQTWDVLTAIRWKVEKRYSLAENGACINLIYPLQLMIGQTRSLELEIKKEERP